MRIKGRAVHESFTKQVELPRPDGSSLCLTLSPLPLGFHSRLRREGVVRPLPLSRVARDSSGQPLRDRQGMALFTADENDPDYLDELERYHQRVAVLVLVESLRADPNVEFETRPPQAAGRWCEYADRLYGELEEAGWTAGDLTRLCDEIARLSNLVTDHVEERAGNFSSARTAAGPSAACSGPARSTISS